MTSAKVDKPASPVKRHRGRDWPRRYEVAIPRHSQCGSARLADLDFDRWFTDGADGYLYLHVWHKDGDSIHRVRCAYSDKPRLCWEVGSLWWLVDPVGEQAEAWRNEVARRLTRN
jgi:hypothetical protein